MDKKLKIKREIIRNQIKNNSWDFSIFNFKVNSEDKIDVIIKNIEIAKYYYDYLDDYLEKNVAAIIIQCLWRKYNSRLKLKSNKIKVIKGHYRGLKGYILKYTAKKVKVKIYIPKNKFKWRKCGCEDIVYLNKSNVKNIEKSIKSRLGLTAKCLDTGLVGIIIKETKSKIKLYIKEYQFKNSGYDDKYLDLVYLDSGNYIYNSSNVKLLN